MSKIPPDTTVAELSEFLEAKAKTFNLPGLGLSFAIRSAVGFYTVAHLAGSLEVGDTFEEAVERLGNAKQRRIESLKDELNKLEAL
jgi:hypothetical protein